MLQVFSASATCLNPQCKTTAVRLSYCFGCFVGLLKNCSLFFHPLLARVHTVSQVCLKKESKMAALKRRPVKKVNLYYTHDVFLFSKTDIRVGVWGGIRVIASLRQCIRHCKVFYITVMKKSIFSFAF